MEDAEKDFVGYMMPLLDEKQRRLFLGGYSKALGFGSASQLAELTGVTIQTISAGRKEIETLEKDPLARGHADTGRVRAPGGGRKSALENNPELESVIMDLIDGDVVGNPMNPLRWTTKSTRNISAELSERGYLVSSVTVGKILKGLGFSLQQNKKYTESGDPGPFRDDQFKFINSETKRFMEMGCPVISVDAKKKELVGNFKNSGEEYRPKGDPRLVSDHDFEGPLGHAIPYGIYDVINNEGFVNVGISADTAEFAVNSISSWWYLVGRYRYPDAKDVMITADGGGSNGSRLRTWKMELQDLADYSGLTFHVRHFPPGTSKWNKIEHKLFSFISMNWKAIPLESYEVVVNLIGNTSNSSGLKVKCIFDEWEYEKGRKVSDDEFNKLNIHREEFQGEWNYTISPRA